MGLRRRLAGLGRVRRARTGSIGAFGYPAGDAGADALAADIAAALDGDGDIALWDAWLAHDSDTYRTMGVGVSKLLELDGGIDQEQATGSKQPTINTVDAPNGRHCIDLDVSALQHMLASGYAVAQGERWGVLVVSQLVATGGTFERAIELNNSSGAPLIVVDSPTSSKFRGFADYDDGGSGASDSITTIAEDTGWHIHERALTNPSVASADGQDFTSGVTVGVSSKASTGSVVVLGEDDPTPSATEDKRIAFALVYRFTGATRPTAIATVRSYLNTYYGGIY